MFDALVDIDWVNQSLTYFLVFGLGGIIWTVWMILSSIVQAKYFVNDEPLKYWSNPLRKTGGYCRSENYGGILRMNEPYCDLDDKWWDCALMLVVSYGFVWIILLVNYVWLPTFIIGGVVGGLFGARAIVRLKKALTKHIEDKNAHQ